jgi:hypothetical protein
MSSCAFPEPELLSPRTKRRNGLPRLDELTSCTVVFWWCCRHQPWQRKGNSQREAKGDSESQQTRPQLTTRGPQVHRRARRLKPKRSFATLQLARSTTEALKHCELGDIA